MKDSIIDAELEAQQKDIDVITERHGQALVNKLIKRLQRTTYTMDQWLEYQHLCEQVTNKIGLKK